jgi:hypothetical protein
MPFEAGVHTQWMLPLGVEKKQGRVALLGDEQGICAAADRASGPRGRFGR